MVYRIIEESIEEHSHIRFVRDDTDVLIRLIHHLQARANNLPASDDGSLLMSHTV